MVISPALVRRVRLTIISESVISGNPTIQSLSAAAPKPSFLFLDKVYQKLSDEVELNWLLRAVQSTIPYLSEDLSKNDLLRYATGPYKLQDHHSDHLLQDFKRDRYSFTWEPNRTLTSSGIRSTPSFA